MFTATYGTLNARAQQRKFCCPRTTWPSCTATASSSNPTRRPTQAIDPAKNFLITSELFGNGRSSSPSNTPEPFHGPAFSTVMTIRDNVNAVHQMLTDELHINHLVAVIGLFHGRAAGFSVGRQLPYL